jgi:hypothetical protein
MESLVRLCGDFIHAFELNGLRSWSENVAVRALAGAWNKPVVSGGDRHGAEPAANLNLTQAATFSEFAAEVRGGASQVVFLPHYREPIRVRFLLAAKDLFRTYSPAESEMPVWSQRFFYQLEGQASVPLRELWPTANPLSLRPFFAGLELAASDRLRPAVRRLLDSPSQPAFA